MPLAPLTGGVNVTVMPLSGLPLESFTVATNGEAKAVSTAALCPEPLVTVTDAGTPAVFVRLKFAGVPTPVTVAATMYPPSVPFAVNTVDVATPLPFVTAVFVVAKLPLAPLLGAVNVTVIPLSRSPPVSLTVTTSGDAKAVLTAALCPEPLVTVTEAGAPTVLVSEKVAGVETPATEAETL